MTTKEHLTLHDKQITPIRNQRNLETLVMRWGRPSGFVVCLAGDKKRSPTPLGNGNHK